MRGRRKHDDPRLIGTIHLPFDTSTAEFGAELAGLHLPFEARFIGRNAARCLPASRSNQELIAMINQTLRGDAPISSSPLTLNRNEAGYHDPLRGEARDRRAIWQA